MTKKPTDLLETKLLKTQIQYQGKFTWLKRNKQEIQSLKSNLYYTTLPFEQFDSFMTVPTHRGFQLHWLPFPWAPAEAVLCLDNMQIQSTTELHTTHKGKRHPTSSQLVWCSQRESHIKPRVYQIINTHYYLVKALRTRNSLPLASKFSIKFQRD